jgi:hypothetical protein
MSEDGTPSGIGEGGKSERKVIDGHFVFNQSVKYNGPEILSSDFQEPTKFRTQSFVLER